jgi:glycosyltransferase involved in cell wall biosynthesis
MTSPRVSVLIPTFKYARYLPEAIESVLGQQFADFELLISDDCSGDGSAEILMEYAARDPRIRAIVQEKNLGMVQNWNWCLSQARGVYVKYLFGDDKLARPDALGKMVAMLEANPGAALAVCARLILDEQSKVVEVSDHFGVAGVHGGAESMFQCLSRGNVIGEPTVVMFPRECAARGFSVSYRQLVDLEMWLHLLEHGSLVYTREPLCAFRKHPLQQTESNKPSLVHQDEHLRLALDYCDSPALKGYDLRNLQFIRLYRSRKFGREASRITPSRPLLMNRFGRFRYCAYWIRRKLMNPFLNLRRTLKRDVGG